MGRPDGSGAGTSKIDCRRVRSPAKQCQRQNFRQLFRTDRIDIGRRRRVKIWYTSCRCKWPLWSNYDYERNNWLIFWRNTILYGTCIYYAFNSRRISARKMDESISIGHKKMKKTFAQHTIRSLLYYKQEQLNAKSIIAIANDKTNQTRKKGTNNKYAAICFSSFWFVAQYVYTNRIGWIMYDRLLAYTDEHNLAQSDLVTFTRVKMVSSAHSPFSPKRQTDVSQPFLIYFEYAVFDPILSMPGN